LNKSYTNPSVWDAVDDVAKMIHELDPNHPVTTPLADFRPDVIAEIQARAPAIDFISFQVYGGLFGLPDGIAETGFDGPFMVTEWGTIGYWEMESIRWAADRLVRVPLGTEAGAHADLVRAAHRAR
jgi:hypothetical protein